MHKKLKIALLLVSLKTTQELNASLKEKLRKADEKLLNAIYNDDNPMAMQQLITKRSTLIGKKDKPKENNTRLLYLTLNSYWLEEPEHSAAKNELFDWILACPAEEKNRLFRGIPDRDTFNMISANIKTRADEQDILFNSELVHIFVEPELINILRSFHYRKYE